MRNGVKACPSPNFRAAKNRKITCVIIHATATSGMDSPRQWLCNPESKVSAHYLIGRDGAALELVDEKNVAWHAGESEWRGLPQVNLFSVGIELVNANDGKQSYPPEQFEACSQIVASICKDYGITPQDVVGHKDIAPGRKTDPAGFPLDELRMRLIDLGVKESVA